MKKGHSLDLEVIPIGMKLPRSLVERIERYVARMNKERPGLLATRTSGIRMLLHDALDRAEGGKS